MKKATRTSLLAILAVLTVLIASSCKKDKDQMIPPTLSWKTGSGYSYGNLTLTTNDTILVGITAQKAEENDPLTRFVETQKYDAAAATTILNESFSVDNYSKDMYIYTRGVAGTETYTFTIINRDGLTTTKTMTITVL
ncbi:MAG: hypothetical protein ACJ77K_01565 [Bacteroidia bacterium]